MHKIKRLLALAVAPTLLSACATVPETPVAVAPPVQPASQGVVSAADPRAAEAGAAILRAGGNATDAAFAVMLALTVVEPQSSGIGGGGFLVLDPGDGALTTYDGRETAPAAATPQWFMTDGKEMARSEAVPGGRSTGVPGNIAMMALAHREHGALPWADLFASAIALARDGFVVTERLNRSLAERKTTGAFSPSAQALYYGADGEALPVGTTIRNPALAAFLARLAAEGPAAFYAGANGDAIVAAVRDAPSNPAPMTMADLAAYRAIERAPVCGIYRLHRICGMGPPSSGATTVFAILKQLEGFDLAGMGANDPTSWHLLAESMRLAFADREVWLGDADFVAVPVSGLVDGTYLAERARLISADAAMADAPSGSPPGATGPFALHAGLAEQGTSHFAIADGAGGVASLTSTVEGAFGSGLFVNGYYLNNELTDFSFAAEVDGKPVANRVEAGKRPRSSMSPTIVYDPDGRFLMAIGAAGGPTIIAQVAKSIVAAIDWDLPVADAIAAPNLYAPGDNLYVEQGTSLEAMMPALKALGHDNIRPIPATVFKANAVARQGGRLVGAADPRSEGGTARP